MQYLLAYMYAYAYFKIKKIKLRIKNERKFHRTETIFRRNWSMNTFSTFHGDSVFITDFNNFRQ